MDNNNGVQNTIDSLEKTIKLQPDFVEMDIQETRDGEFVVMHDTDLSALTGHEGGTHDYTLAELTAMTASENGYTSVVASFEDYLAVAEKYDQKLIVEIKTTKEDSANLVTNFLNRYGRRLLAGQHQIQSLDYEVIQQVKASQLGIKAIFILPINTIYPRTVADGYTMEYTHLDQVFTSRSWFYKKLVYAWTPNTDKTMLQMIQLQGDGIITDDVQTLKDTIVEFKQEKSYADLLFLEIQLLATQF